MIVRTHKHGDTGAHAHACVRCPTCMRVLASILAAADFLPQNESLASHHEEHIRRQSEACCTQSQSMRASSLYCRFAESPSAQRERGAQGDAPPSGMYSLPTYTRKNTRARARAHVHARTRARAHTSMCACTHAYKDSHARTFPSATINRLRFVRLAGPGQRAGGRLYRPERGTPAHTCSSSCACTCMLIPISTSLHQNPLPPHRNTPHRHLFLSTTPTLRRACPPALAPDRTHACI